MPAEASAPKKPGEEIVLFLDGEADPFIQAVGQGTDVALKQNRKDVH
ncbi:hypothetical protein [Paenibacillus larvae]|jgi:hypothetical protein|nr:hypothetical protein [Paenibacillus larvae]MDR5567093.1 hypothetical protein [Paenibacillus larvae]MDR5597954.1 hypothetical protein [Paenibacillus larvae]